MDNIFVEFLPPWIETNMQPAFYDKESGTCLQQTARMYDRVNMLVRMFNKLAKQTKTEIESFETTINDTVEEYINKFNELSQYVHDYFDNLDVQEEINNKLDEMVSDGTFETILDEYFADRVRYIGGKFEDNEFSSDANLILTQKHSIMIDCGSEAYVSTLVARLEQYDVTHIDYLIISHYDTDHSGGLEYLVTNGYIDKDTTVYLPYVPASYTSYVTIETDVKEFLDDNEISYINPTDLDVLNVDSLKLTFGNLNHAQSDTYTNYNYTSMVVKIEHHDVISFWAGDAGTPTYNYLYSTGFINTHVNLYKIGHHGIDYGSISPLTIAMSPDYVLMPFGVKDYIINNSHNYELAYLQNNGSKIIPACVQTSYIEFESSFNSLACINGETRSMSACHVDMTLYVDANASTSSIQDGTSAHPFTTIMQAVAYTKNFPEGLVTINVTNGDYHGINASLYAKKHRLEICNSKVRYVIVGQSEAGVTVSPVYISNNSDVRLEKMTVVTNSSYGDQSGVEIWSSNVMLYNCTVTTENDETNNNNGIISDDGSNVYCESVTIKNYKNGIRTNRGSNTATKSMTFTSITTPYSQDNVSAIEPTDILVSYDTDTGTGLLLENINNFRQITINYSTIGSNNRGSCTLNNPNRNNVIFASVPIIGGDHSDYEKRARITFDNDNQIIVDRQSKFYISPDGSSVSIQEELTEKIKIESVFAI